MKILTNTNSIALNQIAVQSMIGGILFGFAIVSFIFLTIGFTNWLLGTAEGPLVELLITTLLGVMSVGRFNSADRYSKSISKLIKED